MAKKGKRVRKADAPLQWYLKQYRRWIRRAGVLAGLAVVAVALWFIVDPLAGPPTALDGSGREVEVGVLDRDGTRAQRGHPAPSFVLADYNDRAVRLDDFEGKVVFVNFWAAWCAFCEEEMPDIVRIAEEFPDEVVVLAVNRGESKGTAVGWTEGHDFPDLPNMHWILDPREEVTRAYRVDGMPQSFFINIDGYISREVRRVTDYEEMRAAVEAALGPTS